MENPVQSLSRRGLLATASAIAGGGLYHILSSGCGVDAHETSSNWRYVPLNPGEVAEKAYQLYREGSCMYAVFASVIQALADQLGEPYRSFPCGMMRYGHGGTGGWGSLCGAINGGAAVFGLLEPDKKRCDGLIAQLFSWYEAANLPIHSPRGGAPASPCQTVSASVLCHLSMGNWVKESGYEASSPERKERCSRLTADVARKVVEILNFASATGCPQPRPSEEVRSCLSCHGDRELADVSALMNCNSCHSFADPHPSL